MKHDIYKLLTQLQSRHGWKKSPYCVCEGLRCCREALARRPEWVEHSVYDDSFDPQSLGSNAPVGEVITAREFKKLSLTENPQGVLLILKKPDLTLIPETMGECVMVLDRLADPGNVGTILRTAWAMGIETIVWTAGTCHPLGAKVIRSGMGAQFAINLVRVDTLADLRRLWPERTVWITSPHAEISCETSEFDLTNSLVVMGNEADGVGELTEAKRVRIPMPGNAESLNVAQAATIFMYEAVRNR